MGRWKEAAIIVGVVLATLDAATPSFAAEHPPSSRATDLSARRHHDGAHRLPPYEPHYYARPYYYRPYPYGLPAPFVLGFGPWWR